MVGVRYDSRCTSNSHYFTACKIDDNLSLANPQIRSDAARSAVVNRQSVRISAFWLQPSAGWAGTITAAALVRLVGNLCVCRLDLVLVDG